MGLSGLDGRSYPHARTLAGQGRADPLAMEAVDDVIIVPTGSLSKARVMLAGTTQPASRTTMPGHRTGSESPAWRDPASRTMSAHGDEETA
jgi:hypothetical protein